MQVLHLDKDNLAIRADIVLTAQVVMRDDGKYKVIINTTQGPYITIFDTEEGAFKRFDYILCIMRSL